MYSDTLPNRVPICINIPKHFSYLRSVPIASTTASTVTSTPTVRCWLLANFRFSFISIMHTRAFSLTNLIALVFLLRGAYVRHMTPTSSTMYNLTLLVLSLPTCFEQEVRSTSF